MATYQPWQDILTCIISQWHAMLSSASRAVNEDTQLKSCCSKPFGWLQCAPDSHHAGLLHSDSISGLEMVWPASQWPSSPLAWLGMGNGCWSFNLLVHCCWGCLRFACFIHLDISWQAISGEADQAETPTLLTSFAKHQDFWWFEDWISKRQIHQLQCMLPDLKIMSCSLIPYKLDWPFLLSLWSLHKIWFNVASAVLPQKHKYLDAESEFNSPANLAPTPYQPPARGTPVEQTPNYSAYPDSNGYTPSSQVPAMPNGRDTWSSEAHNQDRSIIIDKDAAKETLFNLYTPVHHGIKFSYLLSRNRSVFQRMSALDMHW